MRERDVERYLGHRVREIGGRADKWVCPGRRGVPDRLVFLPGGRLYLVELKAPGGRTARLQHVEHARLRALGFDVRVIANKAAVDRFIEEVTP